MITHEGRTYFTRKELGCKHCGMVILSPGFAEALLALRLAWGKPMTPNSVCRCKAHNDKPAKKGGAGGHPRSLHVADFPAHPTKGCCAMDVRWRGVPVAEQLAFARLAWSMGWAVGLHDGFCHIDRRGDHGMARSVFLYGTWAGRFGPAEVMD